MNERSDEEGEYIGKAPDVVVCSLAVSLRKFSGSPAAEILLYSTRIEYS
jgi:hypothetical protein